MFWEVPHRCLNGIKGLILELIYIRYESRLNEDLYNDYILINTFLQKRVRLLWYIKLFLFCCTYILQYLHVLDKQKSLRLKILFVALMLKKITPYKKSL